MYRYLGRCAQEIADVDVDGKSRLHLTRLTCYLPWTSLVEGRREGPHSLGQGTSKRAREEVWFKIVARRSLAGLSLSL